MISFVDNTSIRDVILRTNPSLQPWDIQDNPFRWDTESKSSLCSKRNNTIKAAF